MREYYVAFDYGKKAVGIGAIKGKSEKSINGQETQQQEEQIVVV
jgi:hypothetical protein